jgi:hypothetical protein
MTHESRTPPEVNAALPEGPPAADAPPTQGVLTVNDDGVASSKKQGGKAGGTGPKGRTAAKRKPEKKLPAAQKKAKAVAKKAGATGRFKSTTEAKGSWKTAAKRTAGSKPTAAQKKTPKKAPKKAAGARKAAPAAKKAGTKRATRR